MINFFSAFDVSIFSICMPIGYTCKIADFLQTKWRIANNFTAILSKLNYFRWPSFNLTNIVTIAFLLLVVPLNPTKNLCQEPEKY